MPVEDVHADVKMIAVTMGHKANFRSFEYAALTTGNTANVPLKSSIIVGYNQSDPTSTLSNAEYNVAVKSANVGPTAPIPIMEGISRSMYFFMLYPLE
jgi:hypothetical protein